MSGVRFLVIWAAAIAAAFLLSGCSPTTAPGSTAAAYSASAAPDAATCAQLGPKARVAVGCPAATWSAHKAARAANDAVCASVGDLAQIAMEARQAGLPLSRVLKATTTEAGRAMALAAYREPAYYSAAGRARAIAVFRADAEADCFARLPV